MFIKSKEAQIKDLQANLGRARNVIHYYEVENKQLDAQNAIYEIRSIKAQKEAAKTKEKLEEVLGTPDDIE